MTGGAAHGTEGRTDGSTAGLPLWLRGVVMLVLILIIATIGGSLALQSSYMPVYLASHIGLALVLVGFSVHAVVAARRSYRRPARVASGLATLSAVAATASGTVFLLGGQSNAALLSMEAFTGVGLVAILLVIVFGLPSGLAPSKSPS